MYRNEKLVIRLSRAEREAIRRLAEAERLPESTMARAILLKRAQTKAEGQEQQEVCHG